MKLRKLLFFILLCNCTLSFSQKDGNSSNLEVNIQNFENKLSKALKSKDTLQIFENGLELISIYLLKPEIDKVDPVIQLLSKHTSSNYPNQYYDVLTAKADYLKYKNETDKSLVLYLKVDKYYNKSNIISKKFKSKVNLLEMYRKLSKLDKAKEELHNAEKILIKNDLTKNKEIVRFYNRAAALYYESGPSELCFKNAQLAIKYAKLFNLPYYEYDSYNILGMRYKHVPNQKMAEKYTYESYLGFLKIGAIREAISTLHNHILIIEHLQNKSRSQIKDIINKRHKFIALAKRNNSKGIIAEGYFNLAAQYVFINDSLNYFRYKFYSFEQRLKELEEAKDIKIQEILRKNSIEKVSDSLKMSKEKLAFSNEQIKIKSKQNFITIALAILLGLLLIVVMYLLRQRSNNNEKLISQNKEKDVLIQEIHHRVKNNLQLTISLLNMQMNMNANEQNNSALLDASRRIKSISTVHELLYNQDYNQRIDMFSYINVLIASIEETFSNLNSNLKFELNVEKINLSPIYANAIGMITTELITNSIKHAFQDTSYPKIAIGFSINEDNVLTFLYSDNGNGVADFDLLKKNLGMRLISIFSRQLEGDYQFYNDNGLCFKLNFVLKNGKS